MASIIADSDIIIDFLRGAATANKFETLLQRRVIGTTTINAFEVLAGAKSTKAKNATQFLLGLMDMYDLDIQATQAAVQIKHQLEKIGKPIGMADYLIAGICTANDLQLFTKNKKHFQNIDNLILL